MDTLTIQTLQLWPRKAKLLIKDKNLSIRKLRSIFSDQIIFPWDNNYDQQRMLFSTQIQERPLFIVRAISECDIIHVLNLLKSNNMTVRIVGGRHSTILANPDIFLDISSFKSIRLSKYLHVEAGATQGQVNAYLFDLDKSLYFQCGKPIHPCSLTFPGGSAATVGAAGISTIGGIGTLRRTLGLTIDSIKKFKIIIPPTSQTSAHLVKASKKKNSDLFWALLGGGAANFGVVTEIIYYPLKVNDIIIYQINWNYQQAGRVLDIWQLSSPNRPNSFNEELAVFSQSDGSLAINLMGLYVIPNNQTVKQAKIIITNELLSLGGNMVVEPISSYSEVYTKLASDRSYHSFSIGKTILTNKTVPTQAILDRMQSFTDKNITGSYSYIGLQLMKGAISDKKSDETAYYPRDANFFVDIFNFWDSPVNQEANNQWNNTSFDILFATNGPYTYLGFPIPNLPLTSYYGTNIDRLIKIKSAIDPLNLLKFPGSIC
jgi:hypothetical protein